MSFLLVAPGFVADAASELAGIGAAVSAANTAAVVPSAGLLAVGADEVSAAIAALLANTAQVYQSPGARGGHSRAKSSSS